MILRALACDWKYWHCWESDGHCAHCGWWLRVRAWLSWKHLQPTSVPAGSGADRKVCVQTYSEGLR